MAFSGVERGEWKVREILAVGPPVRKRIRSELMIAWPSYQKRIFPSATPTPPWIEFIW